jgi:CubicO group peptidase (beta-lactamase class C family)
MSLASPAGSFGRVGDTLQRFVDAQVLPGASVAVLVDGRLAYQACVGWADRERRIALRQDHIFRVFSNTKLVTACAALLLAQEGRLDLDEPIDRHLPVLANLRVLRAGATRLDDTEPTRQPVTARHLLTHTAGFSYATVRPGTPLGDAYDARGILLDHRQTLAAFVDRLADLPLLFQPGSRWEYSVCSDVLARLVEVAARQGFESFMRERIFRPLGMADTGFWLPPRDHARLVAFYRSSHPGQPLRGGLQRCDDIPFAGAYLQPTALRSGGGGLVSTLGDMTALVRSLVSPPHALLKPAALQLLLHNQLPAGMPIGFAGTGPVAGRGYSCGGAVTLGPTPVDPPGSQGEVQWGGIAGTHWWVSPATGSAAVIMTQRHMGFWHLFAFQARREIYAALRAGAAFPHTAAPAHECRPAAPRHAVPPAALCVPQQAQ